ncbi:aldehyde dehydrogenase family protein [Oscillibacter sp.]|uniref:aldehyde dehydrogenase family protein n=1 Tax=Oscillibacter sp. TaxID=1945593 RepID=UPI0028998DB4|nr:aldehyde dehydrogenase family protein [Oscillibacter sp.]
MAETDVREYIGELVKRAKVAQKEFEKTYTDQVKIDEVVRAIGKTIYDNRAVLAKDACDETQYGTVKMKESKIVATTTSQWNIMRGKKSVGYIKNLRDEPGVKVMAKPMGVIGCVMPSTNPIITIAANGMMSIKCRNACIIASHPSAKNVSAKTVDMVREAIAALGAPADLIQIVDAGHASIEATSELLAQCDCNIATGGPGMVKSVYSCGRPGFGVGQGNCQEIICEDWDDLEFMTTVAINNRSYDNGVPCTSEQTIHVPTAMEANFLKSMQKNGAYLIEGDELKDSLRKLVFPDGEHINRAVVGRSPQAVGEMLGIAVPETCKTLMTKYSGSAEDDVLSREILFPLVRYVTYDKFEDTVAAAVANLEMEGAGHNSCIWTHNQDKIEYAANLLPVSRFQINQTPFGINNGMPTTSTLGCGTWGNNSISENLAWYHLMNTTRVSVTLKNRRTWKDGDWDDFGECPITED